MNKEEWCLGHSCRFYKDPVDATCFNQGVFPQCSPEWKHTRIRLDNASLEMYKALKQIQKWLLVDGEIDRKDLYNEQFIKANDLAYKALAKVEAK